MYNPYTHSTEAFHTDYYTTGGSGGAPQEGQQPSAKRKKAPWIAGAALVVALSGAAGGGGAWVVTNRALQQMQEMKPVTTTIQQATEPSTVASTAVAGGSVAAVVQKAAASVVEITTEAAVYSPFLGQSVRQGAGSGVVLSADGYIVTNDHVVNGAKSIQVRTQDGKEYDAELVGTDAKTDLAVVRIQAEGLTPVVLADSDNVQVGELAVAIGNPLGQLGGTVTSGIISAKGREITIGGETMTLLQTSAAVNPGNSGGGLFNARGELVGVVNAKSTGDAVEGLAFAIPANTVKQVAEDLIEHGYVSGRPELGISVVEVNDPQTAAVYGVNKPGVYVVESRSDNGLQAGDRIAAIGDTVVDNTADIGKVLSKSKVGDTLKVYVERDGKQISVDVVLREQMPVKKSDDL